jgi:hypothetical protein
MSNMNELSPPGGEIPGLVVRVAAADCVAPVELHERYPSRSRRMVALRLHLRLQDVDPWDAILAALLGETSEPRA